MLLEEVPSSQREQEVHLTFRGLCDWGPGGREEEGEEFE